MFASSPFRGSFLRGVLALSVKPCRACQLSQRESPWQCGKVSGSSAKFAGVSAPPGGAVAQRLRGFKSAEPEKTVKRSSRRTGVNLQFFPVEPSSLGLKGASSPFFVAPARRNRWHFSGSLLVSKENIPRQAETSLAETILNLPTQKAAAAPSRAAAALFTFCYQPFRKAGRGLPSLSHW